MRRACIVLVLAAALAAPATAQAGWKTERATQIARVVWHHPNVDRMQIRWGLPPAAIEDANGWTYIIDGIVWLDERRPLEWEPFCTTVLHEAGHLAGMGHSHNTASVMYPDALEVKSTARVNGKLVTQWDGTDPRCRDRGRPFLAAHVGAGTLR